jgi:hypothetical protein
MSEKRCMDILTIWLLDYFLTDLFAGLHMLEILELGQETELIGRKNSINN